MTSFGIAVYSSCTNNYKITLKEKKMVCFDFNKNSKLHFHFSA